MSPNKTLYIRDTDVPVWDRAEKQAAATGQSVSQLATLALKEHLAAQEDLLVLVVRPDQDVTFDQTGAAGLLAYDPYRGSSGGWTAAWRLTYLDENGDPEDHVLGAGLTQDQEEKATAEARDYLRERQRGEMEKITVRTGRDYELTEGFTGRWLLAPDSDETRTGEEGFDAGTFWGVALTRRGKIAVYAAHCHERHAGMLQVYPSLDVAAANVPEDILAKAADALGVQRVIWRDI